MEKLTEETNCGRTDGR